MDDWRAELDELVARGRSSLGETSVRAALEEVLTGLVVGATSVHPLTPVIAVLGVGACDGGWVGVLVRPSGQTTLHVGSSLVGMVEQVRDQEALGAVGIVAGPRLREMDAWLHTRPTLEVIEVDNPDIDPQHLADAGLILPAMYGGMGFAEEELRIAGAAVIQAARAFS